MQKVFTDRGIKPRSARGREVIEGRGYRPYSAGEIDVLWAVDPKYRDELLPGQRGWIRSLIRQRDGIVMPRHRALPEFANPWAQIRPYREGDDDPGLITQRWAHRHVRAELHTHTDDGALSLALATRKENYVATRRHISGRWLRSHIAQHPSGPEESRLGFDPEQQRNFKSWDGWHTHYINWDAHLANDDYAGQHEEKVGGKWHEHTEFAKYLYAPGEGRAKGLDVNPAGDELLRAGGERVYFVLEGILKNDAVLNCGAPVFNCGSVTLWPEEDELRTFAVQRLVGKFGEVVVVPDNDWATNPQVSRQAHLVREHLARLGLDVTIAAPPATCADICQHRKEIQKKHKQGVDDLLGKGGTLQDLLVHVKNPKAMADEVRRRRGIARLIEHCAEMCDPLGYVYLSWDELADVMGVDRSTVRRAINDAEGEGLITYDAPLADKPGEGRPTGTIRLRRDLRPTITYRKLGESV